MPGPSRTFTTPNARTVGGSPHGSAVGTIPPARVAVSVAVGVLTGVAPGAGVPSESGVEVGGGVDVRDGQV